MECLLSLFSSAESSLRMKLIRWIILCVGFLFLMLPVTQDDFEALIVYTLYLGIPLAIVSRLMVRNPDYTEARKEMMHWWEWQFFFDSVYYYFLEMKQRRVGDARQKMQEKKLPQIHDYSDKDKEDFEFDFLADSGDGFDSTYTVAYSIAQGAITDNKNNTFKRPGLVIHGGDLSYPWPGRVDVQSRFITPYELASPRSQITIGDMFIIPGNHEWPDGLATFCQLILGIDLNGQITRGSDDNVLGGILYHAMFSLKLFFSYNATYLYL
jgi:hypothetical protein